MDPNHRQSAETKARNCHTQKTIRMEWSKLGNPEFLLNVPEYKEGELIYSLLGRMAIMNGARNVIPFLGQLGLFGQRTNWSPNMNIDYDFCRPTLYDVLKLNGTNEWITSMTVSGLTRIHYSQYVQMMRMLQYADPDINLASSGLSRFAVRQLRVCPYCYEEDKQKGEPYFRRIHQIPGLELCPRHRSPLMVYEGLCGEEFMALEAGLKGFRRLTPRPDARAFAHVCLCLSKINPVAYFQDLVVAISKLSEIEKKKLNLSLPNVMKSPEKKISTNTEELIRGIAQSVADVEGLFTRAVPDYSNLEAMFINAIKGRFILCSAFNVSQVRLTCCHCGFTFDMIPQAMIAGFGCPQCEFGMPLSHRFKLMLSRSGADEEWLVDEIPSTASSFCKVKNLRTGNVTRLPVWEFLFRKTLPEATTARWMNPETKPASHRDVKGLVWRNRIEETLAKAPGFEFVGVSRQSRKTKVTLRHKACGETFDVDLSSFRVSPICKKCRKDNKNDVTEISSKIQEVSNGTFSWCGTLSDEVKEWKATNGKVTVCESGPAKLLNKIKRVVNADGNQISHADLYKDIQAQIKRLRGHVFFNEDLKVAPEYREQMTKLLRKLEKDGKLKSLGPRIWCGTGEEHSALEVIEKKYGNRYGNHIGIPVCDTLLSRLGLIDDVKLPAYALPGSLSCHESADTVVMGRNVFLAYYGFVPLKAGVKTIQFVMTIKFSRYVSAWNEEIAASLASWARKNGVTEQSVLRLYEAHRFKMSTVKECLNLLKKESV